MHHRLNGVEYAAGVHNDTARKYGTFEGSDVHIACNKNGTAPPPDPPWVGVDAPLPDGGRV